MESGGREGGGNVVAVLVDFSKTGGRNLVLFKVCFEEGLRRGRRRGRSPKVVHGLKAIVLQQSVESCDEKTNLFMRRKKKRPLFCSGLVLVGYRGDGLKKRRRGFQQTCVTTLNINKKETKRALLLLLVGRFRQIQRRKHTMEIFPLQTCIICTSLLFQERH